MADKIDSSFFAAIRATICFILADKKIHPKERAWFLTLLDGHGLSAAQRSILDKDFDSPPKLDSIFLKIHDPHDREKLISWAKRVIEIDNEVPESERILFQHLLQLNLDMQAPDQEMRENYRLYANELLAMEERNEIWRSLEEFGTQLNQRPVVRRGGLFFGFLPSAGWTPSNANVYLFWFAVVLAVVAGAAKFFIK